MAEGMKVEITETLGSKVEETQKPIVKEEVKKEEPRYVKLEDLEKVNQAISNTREYNNRQLAEIKATLESLKPKPVVDSENLDEVVQQNWQVGVEKVVERVLSRNQQKNEVQTQQQLEANLLEQSKKKAMERHPELSDPENPKTKEFLKVLEQYPDLKINPRGPELAAYEMENRLKVHDKIESGVERVPKETRSRAASVPAGSPTGNKGAYSLNKQDLDFCRLNNINPENYKRFKGQREVS